MKLSGEMRVAWKERGLCTERASAGAVPPPAPGFYRLYHLLPADYAIKNIENSRIKVALLSELNDPFELFALNVKKKRVSQMIEAYKEELKDQQGLLCFSNDWLDPVLWTHYAAKHSGICLGFDVKKNRTLKVKYAPKKLRKKIEETATALDTNLREQLIVTKFKSWSYEQERRVLINLSETQQEGDLRFFGFTSWLRLREVVLGALCTHAVEEVRALTKKYCPDAYTYGARLGGGLFGIVPREKSSPSWPPP
jgi:hypothetical protein